MKNNNKSKVVENKKTEKIFSTKLKLLRTEKKLSQGELGKLIGAHYTLVSRYERGLGLPSIDAIKTIAKKLKVSIDYLLFDDNDNIATANINDSELLEAFYVFDRMNLTDKEYIKKVLQAFILQFQVNNSIFKNNGQKN